jgi:hypothetical protein
LGLAGIVDYGGTPVRDRPESAARESPSESTHDTRLVIAHYTVGERKYLLADRGARPKPCGAIRGLPRLGHQAASPPHIGPVALDSAGSVHWST